MSVDLLIFSLDKEEGKTGFRGNAYPPGMVPGALFSPVRSRKSAVLPAALPLVGTLPASQTARWSSGMVNCFWMSRGASTKVARRPEATCHSMWQWKSQTPKEKKC